MYVANIRDAHSLDHEDCCHLWCNDIQSGDKLWDYTTSQPTASIHFKFKGSTVTQGKFAVKQ